AFALPMAQPSAFEGRVIAILDPQLARHGLTRRAAAMGAALLLLTTVTLAALAPAQEPAARRSFDQAPGRMPSPTPTPAPTPAPMAMPMPQPMPTPTPFVTGGGGVRVHVEPRVHVHVQGDHRQGARDGAAIAALIGALGDSDEEVRVTAAHALGNMGGD